MNKNKIFFGFSIFGVLAMTLALIPSKFLSGLTHRTDAVECVHVGNHYSAKEKTCTEPGNLEFWACCKCQRQYTEKPLVGTWVDLGQYDGILDEDHIARIPASHEYGEYKLNTEFIGKTIKECEDCHDIVADGIPMTSENIDLNNVYGAGLICISDSDKANFWNNKEQGYLYWEGNTAISTMNLPRVDYTIYKEVRFHINCVKLWGQIGFSEANTFGGFGDSIGETQIELVVIKMADETYKATLSCPEKETSVFITNIDTDVLSGAKPIPLYLKFGAYTCLTLLGIDVSTDYIHEHSYKYIARNPIGISDIDSDCVICGSECSESELTRTSRSEDVDYSQSLYGATQIFINTSYDESAQVSYSSENGGVLKYVPSNPPGERYNTRVQYMPKIDFSKFDKVTFPIEAKAYYGINFGGNWEKGDYIHGVVFTGSLELTMLDIDKIQAKLIDDDNTEIAAKVFTGNEGQQIFSGQKGASIGANIAEPNDYLLVGVPQFEDHTHTFKYIPNDIIGTSIYTCSICGEKDEANTRVTESGDIDYSRNLHGARIEYVGSQGWNKSGSTDADTWRANTVTYGNINNIVYTPGINGANFKLSLPKIDFSKYESVTFPINGKFYEIGYGVRIQEVEVWDEGMIISGGAEQFTGSIHILTLDKNQIQVTFVCDKFVEGSISKVIESENVFNGLESVYLGISTKATNPIFLGIPTFTEHKHVKTPIYTSIGGTVEEICSICDAEMGSRAFMDSDINYNLSIFGASGDTDFDMSVDSRRILVKGHNGYKIASTITLPKINFNNIDVIHFELESLTEYGYWLTNGYDMYDGGTFKHKVDLSLTFTNNGTNVSVVLTDGNTELSYTITDENILSGEAGFKLYTRMGESTDYIYISEPTLFENIDGYNIPVIKSNKSLEIAAYCPPYANSSNATKIYSDMKDAGFTKAVDLINGRSSQANSVYATINGYHNGQKTFDEVKSVLDSTIETCYENSVASIEACDLLGLKFDAIIGTMYDIPNQCSGLTNAETEQIFSYAWPKVKEVFEPMYEKFNSFVVFDEPQNDLTTNLSNGMGRLKTVSQCFENADMGKMGTTNLLPYYGSNFYSNVQNYRNYISYYLDNLETNFGSNLCSIDQYAQRDSSGVYSTYETSLLNYYLVADELLDRGNTTNLGAYIHTLDSTEYEKSAIQSADDIRFQMFQAMTFGAKEITYFEYYRPDNDDANGLVARDESGFLPTYIYNYAKTVNAEAKYLTDVCGDFDWKGIMKCGSNDFPSIAALTSYVNNGGTCLTSVTNSSLDNKSYLPTIVGCMNDGNRDGFFVMNYRNPQEHAPEAYNVTLTFNSNPTHCLIVKDGEKHIASVTDNQVTFSLGGDHAAFVIPLSL